MDTIFSVVTDGDSVYLVTGDGMIGEPIDGFEVKSEMSEADLAAKVTAMVKAALQDMDVRGLFF